VQGGLPVLTNAQVSAIEQRMATMAGSGISKTNQELDLGPASDEAMDRDTTPLEDQS
jgi:hypothetical protein